MADEQPTTGSIPETLALDAPNDVDFTAVMARAQAQLVYSGGLTFAANADLESKLKALREAGAN